MKGKWRYGILKAKNGRNAVVYMKIKWNGKTFGQGWEVDNAKEFLKQLKADDGLRKAFEWSIYRMIGMEVTGHL